jgi:hypothetical protein
MDAIFPFVHQRVCYVKGCYGLQKAVTTCNSADGTRGKPELANLSADLQIGQSRIGGKKHPIIFTFAIDFRVIVPPKLVGTLYSPAWSLPQRKLLVSNPSSALLWPPPAQPPMTSMQRRRSRAYRANTRTICLFPTVSGSQLTASRYASSASALAARSGMILRRNVQMGRVSARPRTGKL